MSVTLTPILFWLVTFLRVSIVIFSAFAFWTLDTELLAFFDLLTSLVVSTLPVKIALRLHTSFILIFGFWYEIH